MKNGDVADKKKSGDSQKGSKNHWFGITVGLVVVLVLSSVLVCGGKQCPLKLFNRDVTIGFQTLQGGIQFKTPAGANVTLSVVSSEEITVTSVKQEGKDTVVRLSPAVKK